MARAPARLSAIAYPSGKANRRRSRLPTLLALDGFDASDRVDGLACLEIFWFSSMTMSDFTDWKSRRTRPEPTHVIREPVDMLMEADICFEKVA